MIGESEEGYKNWMAQKEEAMTAKTETNIEFEKKSELTELEKKHLLTTHKTAKMFAGHAVVGHDVANDIDWKNT